MSDQQMQGLALLLVGVAVLIVSVGTAWALARRSRARRVDGTWLITLLSVVLLLVGTVLCWFGVSAIVEA
jgi:amino acid transporter